MKRLLLLTVLFSLLNITSAQAEVNLRINPLGLLFGQVGLSLDLPVSRTWSVGPQVNYMDSSNDGTEVNALGVGIRANYWFGRDVFTQGWYMGPAITYASAKVVIEDETTSSKAEGKATGIGASVLFGYQWMWESFNINLGFGPSFVSINNITATDDAGNTRESGAYGGTGLAGEFTFGWKF